MEKEFKYMIYKNYKTGEVQIYTEAQTLTTHRTYIFNLVSKCNMVKVNTYKSVNGRIDKGYEVAKNIMNKNGMKLKVLFDFKIENKAVNRFINAINIVCFAGIAIGFITVALWVLLK